jgi:hypothetical protein
MVVQQLFIIGIRIYTVDVLCMVNNEVVFNKSMLHKQQKLERKN